MAMLALYLALYPALVGSLLQKLAPHSGKYRNLLLFPALWVLTEWARGWVMTGFPWLWAGYSQTMGPLKELASIIGTLGLSFVIAIIAGSLALLAQKRWHSAAIIIPLTLIAAFIAPIVDPIKTTGKTASVVLVQGNIAQSMKWNPDALWPTMLKYMDLTRPDLEDNIVIWPEAAIPAPESMVGDFLVNANKVANLNNSAIITGIISHQHNHFYNALIVLGNHNKLHQAEGDYQLNGDNDYKKHHLLPIGEFVPFEELLRPIAPFFNLPMSSFARGAYQQPNLTALGYHIAAAICYEIAFPEQLRDNITPQTDFLLTVSNDAWFGHSNGPLQHMEIAQMRAIEFGRPLVRSTNNGVTAVVDAKGNIIKQLPQFEAAVLKAKVPLVSGETWFYRFGQWPVLGLSWLLFIFAGIRYWQQTRRR